MITTARQSFTTGRYFIRFPGQYYDAETALHYNYHRYYDPGVGRYVSADPIGQWGGINVYRYARGNPANMVDPPGLCPPCAVLATPPGAAAAAAAVTALAVATAATIDYASDVLADVLPNVFASSNEGEKSDQPDSCEGAEGRNPAQDKALSPGEIRALEDGGVDVHDLKGGESTGQSDLYKDKSGNIYVKPKGGAGPGEPTGYNINNFPKR